MSDKPIGIYSMGLCGIEVYEITEENVFYKFNSGNKDETLHRAKLHDSKKGGYFNTMFGRVSLNSVLRTDI